jgi:D-alanyl-D-alanine dipeptidase
VKFNCRTPAKIGLLFLFLLSCSNHITIPQNKYGLQVVNEHDLYERLVAKAPEKRMVEVEKCDPRIRIDIRYATENNFLKKKFYPEGRAFARVAVAQALSNIQTDLKKQGLGLKIFDAYRPYSITEQFWEAVHDPLYAADPAQGSRHNRGCAVDLTIIDLKTGDELAMPSGYDEFTERAHHNYTGASAEEMKNRRLFRDVMEKHGFAAFETEWWHYDFKGYEQYELMDLPFSVISEERCD